MKLGANYGTRQIAPALGRSRTAVRDRLDSAMRKMERAMREEPADSPRRSASEPWVQPEPLPDLRQARKSAPEPSDGVGVRVFGG